MVAGEREDMAVKAEEIDREIMQKRWAAYPLLIEAVRDLLAAFAEVKPDADCYHNVDRAVQLLVLLGEKELPHVRALNCGAWHYPKDKLPSGMAMSMASEFTRTAREAVIEECAIRAENYAAHNEANISYERQAASLDIADSIRALKK